MDVLGGFLATGDVEIAAARRAGTDENRVPVLAQERLHSVDALSRAKFDAKIEDIAALLVYYGIRQAELRDLSANHAAVFGVLVKYDAVVAKPSDVARNSEGCRAAPDLRDGFDIFLHCRFGQ